ncbi:MAG: FAD:protein FMN transferase [Chloroflexi bacterium]|nr:FAD:protein FMN transferase [Chloroflexota bacterium]
MKQTRLMMGMPIIVEVVDASVTTEAFDQVFDYFAYVDAKFSTYKSESEISQINRGELTLEDASSDMQLIFALAEQTRQETDGFFDIRHGDSIDPSGIVKGWAIYNAAELLLDLGYENFYVDAGGDVQVRGKNAHGDLWRLGIGNPFNLHEIVKTLALTDCGIATSGTYVRGNHIYNPLNASDALDEIVSLTVIGPNIYEADRFATAAFAMGRAGIRFIEQLDDFEGYMIDKHGRATMTSHFARYVVAPAEVS